MLVTDEHGIQKNIKASYRKKLLINFMYFFIVSFFGFSSSYLCWTEIQKINFFTIFVFIVSGIFIFCFLRPVYHSFKKYINPEKYGILKKYPNIHDIINEINDTVEYEDRKLVISTKYLISKKDYTKIISLRNLDRIDIATVTIGRYTYHTITGYYLIFLELDGTKNYIYYDVNQKQEMDYVISVLESKCPNISSGGYAHTWTVIDALSATKNINSDNRNSNPVFSIKTPEENLDDIKLRSIISRYEENEKNKN